MPGRIPVQPAESIAFWEPIYEYPDEHLYTDNIGKSLTPERVKKLYLWKNGGRLSEAKQQSVERNFIRRISEVRRLPDDTPPMEFLQKFDEGGAIWRIFWLHLWQPDRFPIYDQHVHRAAALIRKGIWDEIPSYDPRKIKSYVEDFLPFIRASFRGLDRRRVDRALWTCGKKMKAFGGAELPAVPEH